ncbi:hypothetical protein J5N97_002415 [Dioscorea zingiberensis]|uniref:Uncharacterized protein n=1 Tax=Dioscorea zingiberensis TaxID=325984 RepID=A0A9D5D3Q0_9LILI|nr:hypothetical protein J5N97_002415 [Dioscorea zingiberensis]
MAEKVDDGLVWLPSEFLDDELELFRMGEPARREAVGFGMDLNSPTESLTETESDEEDYLAGLAGLTRQMAHSFLDAGEDTVAFPGSEPKVMAGSPQSTLCAVEGWPGLSKGKPNVPAVVWSPPETPIPASFQRSQSRSCDLLFTAAEQVMRMRLAEQEKQFRVPARGLLGTPKKAPPPAIPNVSKIRPAGSFANSAPIPTLQQLEFERLKQEQLIKQQISAAWGKPNRARVVGGGSGVHGRPLGLAPSAWPSLQQQHQQPGAGSGMRAIFLNGSGSRRESAGTGVFLPRRAGNTPETRRKPACSTVLLPARVVQALNLNLDELNANSRFPGGYVVDHDLALARGSDNGAQAKRNQHHHRLQPATAATHDVRLPPEWTY